MFSRRPLTAAPLCYSEPTNQILMTNWQPLLDELSQWQQIGRTAKFWWRDDDAISDTPALRTLLTITDPLPIAIAAIPAKCDVTLSELLASYSRVAVFQHGWRHLKRDGQQ